MRSIERLERVCPYSIHPPDADALAFNWCGIPSMIFLNPSYLITYTAIPITYLCGGYLCTYLYNIIICMLPSLWYRLTRDVAVHLRPRTRSKPSTR